MENVFLTSLTLPEVKQLLRTELETFFAEKKREPLPAEDSLLTILEAAGFLRLQVPTLYGLVHKSQIPYMKKSKRLYFSKDELTAWLKAGRRKTVSEIKSSL